MQLKDISEISDKIRLNNTLNSRKSLLIKQNCTTKITDDFNSENSRKSSFDNLSMDLPINIEENKSRVASALSASPSNRERNICWRNIMKSEERLLDCHYNNKADRITASEMCKFTGHKCKFCCCKLRISSRHTMNTLSIKTSDSPNISEFQGIINMSSSSQDNPFIRLISNKRPKTLNSYKHSQLTRQTSTLYFVNLKQLETKLAQGVQNESKNKIDNHRLISAERHNAVVARYKNICHINVLPRPEDILHITPPLMPLYQQNFSNSFFI